MAEKVIDVAMQSTSDEILSAVNAMASSSSGVIKSVQRGVITFDSSSTTKTATISAVDTTKAFVLWGGSINGGSGYGDNSGNWDARLDLTSSTVVTATKYWAYASTISYQVVEFY